MLMLMILHKTIVTQLESMPMPQLSLVSSWLFFSLIVLHACLCCLCRWLFIWRPISCCRSAWKFTNLVPYNKCMLWHVSNVHFDYVLYGQDWCKCPIRWRYRKRQQLHRQSAKHSNKLKHLDTTVDLGNRPLLSMRQVRMRNSDKCFRTKFYQSAVLDNAGSRVYQSLMKLQRGFCEPAVCHRVYRWDLKSCLHAGNTELHALQQEGPTGISGHQIAMRVIGRKTEQKLRKLRKHWRINVLFSAGFVKYWFLHTWFVWGLAKPGSFEAILAVMIHHLYTCICFSCDMNLHPSCLKVGKIILLLWQNASQNPLSTGCTVSIFQFCSAGTWKSLDVRPKTVLILYKACLRLGLSNKLIRCYWQIRNTAEILQELQLVRARGAILMTWKLSTAV